jgi:HEAT repeat protein
VPALIAALNANKAPELRAGCIIALGRLGDLLEGDVQGRVTGALVRELSAEHAQVRETAALALGLLGHDEALGVLFELLSDSDLGREYVDRGNVMPRTRAFASLGLALGGREREASVRLKVGRELSARLGELSELADAEAAACCLIALGLSPQPFAPAPPNAKLPGPGLSEQIAQVLELTLDRGTRVPVAAHGPEALARLVAALPEHPAAAAEQSRVVRALLDIALERGAARQLNSAVRDGALLALGELAPEFSAEEQFLVAEAFERVLERSTGMGPAYSLLGLGRLAACTGGGLRKDLEQRLTKELQHAPHRRGAWASLALGLSVHESEAGRAVPAHLRTLWASTLERARSPEFASAVGVSVGLARLSQEETRLLRQFEDLGEDLARGYLAEALGLAGARGAKEHLGLTLAEAVNRPLLLGKVAMALGLLEDGTVQTRLLEALEESPSTHAQAYLAAAVGIVGDVSAIGPLTQILDDEGRDPRLRAFAAAALGRIADPDRLPWNAVLARGLNYRHAPASLFDGSGRGALELL